MEPGAIPAPQLLLLLPLLLLGQQALQLLLVLEWVPAIAVADPSAVLLQQGHLVLLQLLLEAEVGAHIGPHGPGGGEAALPAQLGHRHEISHQDSGAAGHPGQAMDEAASAAKPAFMDELDALLKMLQQVLAGRI